MPNEYAITAFFHCGLCLDELPKDIPPREYASLEVGYTATGLQVWCKRHEVNVIHIDFGGHRHPSRYDHASAGGGGLLPPFAWKR